MNWHEPVAWHSTEEVITIIYSRTCLYTANPSLTAIFGPAATTWFKFLQNNVVLKNKNLETVARVGLDQTVFASTNLFCFLSSMALMEGSSPKDKLESTYWTALSKNWMVWPFVQAINFTIVPLHHRVLVVNVISLGWNCYLSFLNSQGPVAAAKEEAMLVKEA